MIIRAKLKGLDKLAGNMNRFFSAQRKAAQFALTKIVLEARREAIKQAPKVTGHLRKSCFAVSPEGKVIAGANPGFENIVRGAYFHRKTVRNAYFYFHRLDALNYRIFVLRRRGRGRFTLSISRGKTFTGDGTSAFVGFSMYYGMKVHENPLAGKQGHKNKRGRPRRYSRVGSNKFLKKATFDRQQQIVNYFYDIMVWRLSKVRYKKTKVRAGK